MASHNGGGRRGILDLQPQMHKQVRVRFQGGREVVGTLTGYDAMVNVVLENAVEYLRVSDDPYKRSGKTRSLGRVVCKGTNVTMVAPEEGYVEIANPFLPAGGDDVEDGTAGVTGGKA